MLNNSSQSILPEDLLPDFVNRLPDVETAVLSLSVKANMLRLGRRTTQWVECSRIPTSMSGLLLVFGLDRWPGRVEPIITIAEEDPDFRMAYSEIYIGPEVVPPLCSMLDASYLDLLNLPTRNLADPDLTQVLAAFPDGDLGGLIVATKCRGLRRDLVMSQNNDEITLRPLQIEPFAQGLLTAFKAAVANPCW